MQLPCTPMARHAVTTVCASTAHTHTYTHHSRRTVYTKLLAMQHSRRWGEEFFSALNSLATACLQTFRITRRQKRNTEPSPAPRHGASNSGAVADLEILKMAGGRRQRISPAVIYRKFTTMNYTRFIRGKKATC